MALVQFGLVVFDFFGGCEFTKQINCGLEPPSTGERAMRFGLFGGATSTGNHETSDSHPYYEFVDYVCEAEQLGFHSVFLVEHHFTGLSQVSSSLGLLTYLAAKTHRMRLGTAVVVLPWHNPILLAEQVATLDLLSNGRFDFGIGRGYRHNEFQGFCIPIDEAGERYEEALEVLLKAWSSSSRFSYHGKRWHFQDIIVEPSTVQKPHPPLWVGAGSPASIRKAGEQGFNLLLDQFGSPEVTGERIASYRAALESQGRVFDPYCIGVTRALHIARSQRERDEAHERQAKFLLGVQALANDPGKKSSVAVPTSFADSRFATEQSALIGRPDEIIERLKKLQTVGAEYVLLVDVGCSCSALRTFAREVMPAFAETPATTVPQQRE
jgi:alkanesulfonate monooxygenase SsuD/methylene tetrahydromethanopterin reductase-like flavin-dependent oxidoreductase (luciferase family)